MKALSVLSILGVLSAGAAQTKPHILLVLADDYGHFDIGYNGNDINTPVLDSLASEGVILDNYYVQPLCTPTRSQLLSGRYQIHTGLQHKVIELTQPNALPNNTPTLADKLKEAGYSTHGVGKWHLGLYNNASVPTSRGFDSFYGMLGGSSNFYTHQVCNKCPSNTKICAFDFRHNLNPVKGIDGQYSTFLYVDRVQQILNDLEDGKPLFLYLALQQVHSPLEVPDSYKAQYASMTDEDRKTYAGKVAIMDEAIGNVTDMFKAKGIWNNTIMVFFSDNGGDFDKGARNWPLRGEKGSLFEGGIKANAFVRADALQSTGANDELIHVTDWYPTLVNLAGGNLTGLSLDGFDQWRTISEGNASPRDEILINIDPLEIKGVSTASEFNTSITAAIRMGKWKLITGNAGSGDMIAPPHFAASSVPDSDGRNKHVWLFNLDRDPYEQNDLSNKRAGRVRRMLRRLQQYLDNAVTPVYPDCDPNADPSIRDGYWGPWL